MLWQDEANRQIVLIIKYIYNLFNIDNMACKYIESSTLSIGVFPEVYCVQEGTALTL